MKPKKLSFKVNKKNLEIRVFLNERYMTLGKIILLIDGKYQIKSKHLEHHYAAYKDIETAKDTAQLLFEKWVKNFFVVEN